GICKGDRLEDHAFGRAANAADTALAPDINPTDLFYYCSLRGRKRLRDFHWQPSFLLQARFLFIPSHHCGVVPSSVKASEKPDHKGASVSSCWRGNLARRLLVNRRTRATSLLDPFCPGGRGAVS